MQCCDFEVKARSTWEDMFKGWQADNYCLLWPPYHSDTTMMERFVQSPCLFACVWVYVCYPARSGMCLRASCRGSALWPLSRFLAVPYHSPFPLVPWTRLPVPLLWQTQRPDCPLCDLPVPTVSQYRWVSAPFSSQSRCAYRVYKINCKIMLVHIVPERSVFKLTTYKKKHNNALFSWKECKNVFNCKAKMNVEPFWATIFSTFFLHPYYGFKQSV